MLCSLYDINLFRGLLFFRFILHNCSVLRHKSTTCVLVRLERHVAKRSIVRSLVRNGSHFNNDFIIGFISNLTWFLILNICINITMFGYLPYCCNNILNAKT